MLSKTIATFLLVTGLMQNSFFGTMPDRNINNELFLVNRDYLVSSEYYPEISTISAYGVTREISSTILDPLNELIAGAKSDGLDMHIVSGYRSYKKQTKVFDKKMDTVKDIDKALDFVALPGSSEHQLGVCADVSYDNWRGINSSFANTKQGKWIKENCYKYGFIVRYPYEYENITGYKYEPWHIRYIGKENSLKIKELEDIPLEYYVSRLRKNKYIEILNSEQFKWKYDKFKNW